MFIQDNTITLAHFDEPCMQNYRYIMETQFNEVKHESKMRLFNTHTHISERRGYELKPLVSRLR